MSILHKNEKTSWHGPAVMLAAFVVVFSAIVFLVNDNRYKAKQSELKTGSESVTKSIRLRLKGNEDYLLMLAKDRAAGALDAKLFQERAGAYVLQHPEIINITWVDADFYIRDVAPLASNKQILGLHLDLSEPKRVSRLAKDTRQPRYTRPFEAIQGKTSFEIWVPVFKGNQFLGLFGGVYSCQMTLQILVPPHLRATSHATLCDTSGNLLAALSKTGRVDQELVHKSFLTPHESGVILQLAPYSRGGADWVLLALEFLCLSLVVAMTCAMWGLKREITVRKRIERELRVKTSQLQRSEDELQKQTDQLEEELAERQMVQESLQDQTIILEEEVEERRRAEEALKKSEATVRNKLKAIIEPEGDIGTLELSDIVDCDMLQSMLQDFYNLTGMLGAVLDASGKVLVAVGWQDICTKFHRCHPETLRNCIESDTTLTHGVAAGTFKHYRCKNGMWDMVTPLEIGGRHAGNVFIGQFFYDDETPDRGFFREQTRRYGFDEAEYLDALDRVPRFSREGANAGMQFYAKLTKMVSTLSFSSIQLSRMLAERIHLEEQLRQSQKMEAVGQFAGGVAHDFNNILQVISGYGHMLKMDDKLNDRQKQEIEHILSSSQKASQLTKGLLAFSRKQVIALKPLNLNEIIENVNNFIARVIGEDIQLKTIAYKNRLKIYADMGQIEQVLVNLASNARDAMQKGGTFTIETGFQAVETPIDHEFGRAEPGRYAVVTVSDTGCGMDAETQKRIFEPFFTTKEVGKGTGLGMSIVYGIIKQHNGFINVYSEPGHGSTFRIYFPLHETEHPVRDDRNVPVAPPHGGSETILLAEDDADVRTLVVTVLETFGYNVIQAVDGQDAVEKFASNSDRISMILMDMIMPRKNGKDAFDEISALHPNVKVLYSSGYTADFIQNRGVSEKGIELIMKPVQPMELLRRIRDILDA